MASAAAGALDPHGGHGSGGEESPQGLTGEAVLSRLATAINQLAQATSTSAAIISRTSW